MCTIELHFKHEVLYVTSAMLIKLTARSAIAVVNWSTNWSVYARAAIFSWVQRACKQIGLLEEMINLFHNILKKN